MKIGIANDHRGVETKQILTKYLTDMGYTVVNYGTDTKDRVDYTKYGFYLGKKVATNEVDYGIAICGSAIGISIACNKVKGIRCGKINSVDEAIHNLNKQIVEAFLNTKENLDDPVYQNRVNQISEYEND